MKLMRFFLLPFLVNPTFAFENDRAIFQKSYINDYQPLMCSHNMLSLIEKFKANDLSLQETFIVHVRALNAPFAEVRAYRSRIVGVQKWSFHAFMVHKQKVFDLDFQESHQVLSFKDYVRKMFFPSGVKQQKLLYQVKPAVLYAGEDFDGSMNSSLYPLEDFDLNSKVPMD